MMTFFSWVAAVGLAACTVLGVWLLHRAFQVVCVKVTPVQVNDDDSVVNYFIELLTEARTSMVVYDDGNNMDGSLYNDDRVIDAVRSKLRANPDFELRCLFNCDDDVEFRKVLANEQQVEIRTHSDADSKSKIHYKIIDEGEKAYLSLHELGATERKYRIVDCTSVSKRHRSYAAQSVLGKHTAHFARAFNAARARG